MNLNGLAPEFREKVEAVIADCARQGVRLKPYYTIRTPLEQAKLYRQDKSGGTIQAKIRLLTQMGAPFLAKALHDAGPQNGPWATSALPGFSWHNWGQAVDCYAVGKDGKPNWDGAHPDYEIYAETAKSFGLTAGYFWPKKDSVHIQLHPYEVLQKHSYHEINEVMQRRYGG